MEIKFFFEVSFTVAQFSAVENLQLDNYHCQTDSYMKDRVALAFLRHDKLCI